METPRMVLGTSKNRANINYYYHKELWSQMRPVFESHIYLPSFYLIFFESYDIIYKMRIIMKQYHYFFYFFSIIPFIH